jgi:hypothetical protein
MPARFEKQKLIFTRHTMLGFYKPVVEKILALLSHQAERAAKVEDPKSLNVRIPVASRENY